MFIVGQVSTDTFLKCTGEYISKAPSKAKIAEAVSAETGIDASDLFVYAVNDNAVKERLKKGDEYTLVWDDVAWEERDEQGELIDSGTNHEITSVDFSIEDDKRIIVFITDDPDNPGTRKSEIIGNGTDISRIYVRAYLPNMSAVDTTYNEDLRVPFIDPDGRQAFSVVTLTNGEGFKDFKTTKYGKWEIKSNHNFVGKNAKVYDQEVYDLDVLMDI